VRLKEMIREERDNSVNACDSRQPWPQQTGEENRRARGQERSKRSFGRDSERPQGRGKASLRPRRSVGTEERRLDPMPRKFSDGEGTSKDDSRLLLKSSKGHASLNCQGRHELSSK